MTGSSTLTANTGITTTSSATGTYAIHTSYELGAFSLMNIMAGEVRLEGVVSGDYGMVKSGDGTLVLTGDNTFGASGGGLGVQGGAVRVEGENAYTGSTSVLWGRIEVASNSAQALGTASSAITIGADSALFAGITDPAELVIDGNHGLARNVNVQQGSFEKRIGAINAPNEAIFSGNIALLGSGANATSLTLFAEGQDDVAVFTGNLSGGDTGTTLLVNADGAEGTVVFSGNNKTYLGNTEVVAGHLTLSDGTSVTGNGDWLVHAGAHLTLNGILSGSGSFDLAGSFGGGGQIDRQVVVSDGATLNPGNSVGTLTFNDGLEMGPDGILLWEIQNVSDGPGTGWDFLDIIGTLEITAGAGNPFVIQLTTLNGSGQPGLLSGFDPFQDYQWLLASADNGISGFDGSLFQFDTSAWQNPSAGQFSMFADGNDLFIAHAAIPEPSPHLLLLMAALLGCVRRGQRKRTGARKTHPGANLFVRSP